MAIDPVNLISLRKATKLYLSLSKYRKGSRPLEDAYIVAGTNVAIWVNDITPLLITNIDFKVNTVLHHTEISAPWDYDGTDGFGNANRVSFVAGLYLVEADITDTSGTYTLSANFEVE